MWLKMLKMALMYVDCVADAADRCLVGDHRRGNCT
jgi:hypothetical protein